MSTSNPALGSGRGSVEQHADQPQQGHEAPHPADEETCGGLIETLNDVVYCLDPAGVITHVSPRAAELSGFSAQALIGRSCFRLVHPEDAVKVQLALRADRASDLGGCRLRLVHRDRVTRYLRVSAKPIYKEGAFAGLIGSATDVTKLIQAQKALGKAEQRRCEALERLRATLDAAVRALARTVEFRDPYTADHQQRVAQLVLAIGERLALSKQRLEALAIGALIHDVGKISVPSEILTRPRALSEAERMIMNEHPEIGFAILAGLKFPGPVARIVREHHERLDGSGYPQGLIGDAICPEARLVAIADVVEAMSSHRPYRPALGITAALEFVSKHSGQLFDSQMVQACIDVVGDGFSFSAEGA